MYALRGHMRAIFLLSFILLSMTSAFGMSTKDKVRLILWSKGIKEQKRPQVNHLVWPEEIEKPLKKF